jgi:hypothetical protein
LHEYEQLLFEHTGVALAGALQSDDVQQAPAPLRAWHRPLHGRVPVGQMH